MNIGKNQSMRIMIGKERGTTMKKHLLAISLLTFASITTACGTGEKTSQVVSHGEVKQLVMINGPTKREYVQGEFFDPTGIVLDAIYEDGYREENVAFEVMNGDTPMGTSKTLIILTYKGVEYDFEVVSHEKGNGPTYSVQNTKELEVQPLKGKTFFFLGSSVTYGASSEGESFADFIAKRQGATSIKKAISGTSLMDVDQPKTNDAEFKDSPLNGKSYVYRFDDYLASDEKVEHVDALVLQLSTNDAKAGVDYGEVTPDFVRDTNSFDVKKSVGAMEYIIAKAKEVWNCPVLLYSNAYYFNNYYPLLVDAAKPLVDKWGITYLNMYEDEEFNNITDEQKSLYMHDRIHPTKAGYRDWWTPAFETSLADMLK